ncbi:MAG: hypothetical protein M2R45_01846 [Verrucomicrobia subdivision 3 bacterium]|nr:hypothetical protein [Limisphaerales bacterium]MCS1415646.1 hypothetical protein [Limisphaerales bacterium]
MFRAIGRWIKAVGYLLTGQVDSARRVLDTNPHVIRAKYDEIAKEKISRIHQFKQAVSSLIAQEEAKTAKIKQLSNDVANLERLKSGALAKAKQTVAKLQAEGKSKEAIHADEGYKKCLAAFNDFSSTLNEKQERIDELEGDVSEYKKTISEHNVQLQQLLREVEKIRSEAADAVAEVISAKQEKEIADTIAGIAEDGTAEELQSLRQMRQEVRAEARIAKEMAGTDTKAQEAEFLEYARTSDSTSEFDDLIGLTEEVEKSSEQKDSKSGDTALPE